MDVEYEGTDGPATFVISFSAKYRSALREYRFAILYTGYLVTAVNNFPVGEETVIVNARHVNSDKSCFLAYFTNDEQQY